jgi:hypothetical protein
MISAQDLGLSLPPRSVEPFPASWISPLPGPNFPSAPDRCLTHRFPYAVIFQYTDSQLIVVAVMHLKREPVSWQNNLPGKD